MLPGFDAFNVSANSWQCWSMLFSSVFSFVKFTAAVSSGSGSIDDSILRSPAISDADSPTPDQHPWSLRRCDRAVRSCIHFYLWDDFGDKFIYLSVYLISIHDIRTTWPLIPSVKADISWHILCSNIITIVFIVLLLLLSETNFIRRKIWS